MESGVAKSYTVKIFEDCVKDLTSCCEQRINMVLKAKGTRKASPINFGILNPLNYYCFNEKLSHHSSSTPLTSSKHGLTKPYKLLSGCHY